MSTTDIIILVVWGGITLMNFLNLYYNWRLEKSMVPVSSRAA